MILCARSPVNQNIMPEACESCAWPYPPPATWGSAQVFWG